MRGAAELALLKEGALLINTSRGAVIDQAALIGGLAQGRPGSPRMCEQQPPAANDPLLQMEQVILTLHIAALTERTFRDMCVRTATKVQAILRGQPAQLAAIL